MRTSRIQWLVTVVVVAAIGPLHGQEAVRIGETVSPDRRADATVEFFDPGKTLRAGIRNLASHHEQALVADPKSVTHHVGLADAYTMLWCFGFAPRDQVLPKMTAAALQAVALFGFSCWDT